METFGHVTSFYYAMRKAGLSKEESSNLVLKHSAKLCLTDSIRYTVKPIDDKDTVVKFGRGYSHCTDGCYMVLPFGDTLKQFTNIHQTRFYTSNGYYNKFADEPTDFATFIQINSQMFEKENEEWGLCALAHLQQDVGSDTTWQHNLCICDTTNDKVVYVNTNKTVNGKKFRQDMSLANILFHQYIITRIYSEFGDNITQDWLNKYPCQSFLNNYEESMAKNTCGYLNMDSRVFESNYSDSSKELFNKLITDSSLISTDYQLIEEFDLLFNDAVAACNLLVNKFAR